jgi:PleD family two-component response regulator
MNPQEEQEMINHTVAKVGELLINNLRKLDLVGRWDSKRLMLLLPETGLMPAIKVTHKIQKLLKDNSNQLGVRSHKLIMNFAVTEYYSSIEETLDRIYNQIT